MGSRITEFVLSRRRFLSICAAAAGASVVCRGSTRQLPELAGEVGITVASLTTQMRPDAPGRRLDFFDLPRVMRDELGMRVIDLNTGPLGSPDPDRLDRFRRSAEAAGCVITNLKVNVRALNLTHQDRSVRQAAIEGYKAWIRAAERLGARWLRPIPTADRPEFSRLVEAYRELADYAAEHRVTLLVENFGWIESDPEAIPTLIDALSGRIAASPDIGNWRDELRYEALARAFPYAVTCDFKVGELGPAMEHPRYDLRRCFQVGWRAGFRGPWCIEHINPDGAAIIGELLWIKESLLAWMKKKDGHV